MLNSRLGRFSAPASPQGPFSRSYGASLPSSLAVTHSSACGCSPRPPVSVSGTGPRGLKLSGFSREPPSPHCRVGRSLPVLSHLGRGGVLHSRPYTFLLQPAIPSAGGGSGPPSPLRIRGGHGNVRPSPLEPASLRLASLRSRLTLIRLALIRKPWSSGAGVSRPRCRYSCLHLPFRALHPGSRRGFQARGMLPYRWLSPSHGFGGRLHARSSSIPARSTGELLRTLWTDGCFQANVPAVSAGGPR